ncbi:MAG TPA: hypothetical protein VM077_03690 [Candidatus Limnocylindrales bacterium]|nr:hypothetical protein [Candidatus Limnocylindrales bacterium]
MNKVDTLNAEIDKLRERNKKVDRNKAWEISSTRKLLIIILTYIVAVITLITIDNPSPFENAIIPSIGFFLSTLTLPLARKLWEKKIYKK